MSSIVWGALAGLVWGALAAFVNYAINRAALKKNSSSALLAANAARFAVDLVALGMVFLLRKQLPFRFEAALIAAAISLSVLNIILAYRLVGKK